MGGPESNIFEHGILSNEIVGPTLVAAFTVATGGRVHIGDWVHVGGRASGDRIFYFAESGYSFQTATPVAALAGRPDAERS